MADELASPLSWPPAPWTGGGIELVCPRCRRLVQGGLHRHHLEAGPAGLACPGCGEQYPMVDGTPVVVRDVDAWLQSEGAALIQRTDLPPAVLGRIARGMGDPLARDRHRAALRALEPDSPLRAWVRALLPTLPGPVLDLGCGAGHDLSSVVIVGLDLHWSALQHHRGPRLLADALDPPFDGDRFGAVLALNLLDSCRAPYLLLQQADALLRPGGTLVLTSPFCWRPDVTAPEAWLEPEQVDGFLVERGYRVERDELDWHVALGPRSTATHRCWTWVARAPSPT